jgi:hypothetical protein
MTKESKDKEYDLKTNKLKIEQLEKEIDMMIGGF